MRDCDLKNSISILKQGIWSHVLDPSEDWIKGLEKRPFRTFYYHKVDVAVASICAMALRRGLLVHFVTQVDFVVVWYYVRLSVQFGGR